MKTTLVLLGLLLGGAAQAKNVRLAATVDGWFLPVEVPRKGAACRVELRDVAPVRGRVPTWVERVEGQAPTVTLWLDAERYVASHTYRMTLRCGLHDVARGLVHLAASGRPLK